MTAKCLTVILIPHKSVGPFRFGEELRKCVPPDMQLVKVHESEGPEGSHVTLEDQEAGIRVTTERGLVSLVGCDRQLLWNGLELIGLTRQELVARLGEPDEWGDRELLSDGYQQPLEYEALGAQMWLKGDRIVSVWCSCDKE